MARPHSHLYEINVRPWLDRLSRIEGRTLALGDVPPRYWDALAARGVDLVYLMGLWARSPLGRQIARSDVSLFPAYDTALPGWTPRDVVGSAFSIVGHEPDPRVGAWHDLDAVREALHERGLGLIVDFVPNHTGFDHPWMAAHPDRYLAAPLDRYREAPDAYRLVETPAGTPRYVACGRDPYFPAWRDVAQLDYFNQDTRAAAIGELRAIAGHADGARCDMAMLVLNEVFERTWGDLTTGPVPATEFWADARAAVPGFLLLAEVYWGLEWRLQQLGFDYTYDKRLYDRLLRGSADEVRAHLRADPEYQRRSVRFIENHDEPRAAEAFDARMPGAAVVVATLPGLRFFHDGQFEGRRVRVPVQLGTAPDEPADARLAAFHDRLLDVANQPVFHEGTWRLLDVRPLDETSRHLLAWRWQLGADLRIVAVCLGPETAHGHVAIEADLPTARRYVFEDLLTGIRYPWSRADVERHGLYVRLGRGQAHVFQVTAA